MHETLIPDHTGNISTTTQIFSSISNLCFDIYHCIQVLSFFVSVLSFETRSYYVAMAASSSSLFFYFDLIIFRHKSVTRDHCLSYTITTVTKVIPNSLFSFSLLSIFTCFLSPSSRPWTLSKMLNRG